jgi:hypothetical protein
VPNSACHPAGIGPRVDDASVISSKIVLAGTGFRAILNLIHQAIPGARFSMIDPVELRTTGCDAEVLIPAMARVDGITMNRIRGLQLVHQWGRWSRRCRYRRRDRTWNLRSERPEHRWKCRFGC